MKYVFLFTAIISIVAVVLICVFLFANGVPAMKEIGFANFLGGTKWKPGNGLYGIFPMILGSIYVTGGALIIGVPIGILMSIFMARFCPDRLHKVLKPIVDLLAGIPSIVYGFFGLVVMVPFVREHFKGNGQSILTAALLHGISPMQRCHEKQHTEQSIDNGWDTGQCLCRDTHQLNEFISFFCIFDKINCRSDSKRNRKKQCEQYHCDRVDDRRHHRHVIGIVSQ